MPRVFIGSSREALVTARDFQMTLQEYLRAKPEDVVLWEDIFRPGIGYLEQLITATKSFDFAVLLLTPDDVTTSRDVAGPAPRDNLVYEAGLFTGALGRQYTFIVADEDAALKVPSDLLGIQLVPYRHGYANCVHDPAKKIVKWIRQTEELRTRPPEHAAPVPAPAPAPAIGTPRHTVLYGADQDVPSLDTWFSHIRPLLHHAANYGSPTYYLNRDLYVVDWNIAFEVVFRPILNKIYYKHVTSFIAELANSEAVFRHAREFTRRVASSHELPLVDSEPIEFHSDRFGTVSCVKFACKLHDDDGDYCGWSVRLDLREIDWVLYTRELDGELHDAALWNLYASAYDAVLTNYPPYRALLCTAADELRDVGGGIAVDVGAGTGNMACLLVDRGFRVVAVENSLSMLEHLRKRAEERGFRILKGSVENLRTLTEHYKGTTSAVTMINVLYAVDDPVACLSGVFHLLQPGGRLVLTTTHRESNFDKLLEDVKESVAQRGRTEQIDLNLHLSVLLDANREIARTIAKRHTRDDYLDWVRSTGFEITRYSPSEYHDALLLVSARKPA